jgi:hypothetical protein
MRIVLTDAGQKEINENNEIKDFDNNQKYKSESKKIINRSEFGSSQNKKLNKINQNRRLRSINHNIYHSITEGNYLNEIIKNKNMLVKEKSSVKYKNTLSINPNKNLNNYKMIKINSSNYRIPSEIKMLYSNNIDNNSPKRVMGYNLKNNDNISLPIISNSNNNKSITIKDLLQTKNKEIANKNILFKKINQNENNLVNYLKMNKTIKLSFMEKVTKANDDKLVKLDKVCQKYFNNMKKNEILKKNIKDKIKLEYSNDSIFCKDSLLNMEKDIKNYNHIYKSLIDKKEDYLEKRALALYLLKK